MFDMSLEFILLVHHNSVQNPVQITDHGPGFTNIRKSFALHNIWDNCDLLSESHI